MDATSRSVIVGFTPINPVKRQISSQGIDGVEIASSNPIMPPKSSSYTAGQKRKRSQASGLIAAPKTPVEGWKPKSVPKHSKNRYPTDQDIPRDSKVTKQIHPTAFKPCQDMYSSTSTGMAAKKTKSHKADDTSFLHEAFSILGEKHQTAYLGENNNTMSIDTSTLFLNAHAQMSDSPCPTLLRACVTGAAGDGWMSPTTIQPQGRVACALKDTHRNQDGPITHRELCRNLPQSQREFQVDFTTPYQQSTKCSLPAVLQPEDLCSSYLTGDDSAIQQTASSFVLYEDPEMLLPVDAAMDNFQAIRGQLLHNSYDDDFPMEDEGIEEMLKLIEIKQGKDISASSPAFKAGYPNDTYLTDDIKIDDLGWLDDFPCLDMHKSYEDGEALPRVAMNRSDAISLPTSDSKSAFKTSLHSTNDSTIHTVPAKMIDADFSDQDENFFSDDDLDAELLKMAAPVCGKALKPAQYIEPVKSNAGKLPSLAAFTDKPEESSFPISPTDIPHVISFDANGNPVPFIRPPFPKSIRDRSPIPGLGTHMVLRTCFRIGEALNAASVASRSKTDAIIELYAHVISSVREPGSFKQNFQFSDLFTAEKPPFLEGTYALWKGVKLWDHDAKAFVGEKSPGRMARVMGRIKKEAGSKKWEMAILSVWRVDWADIGIAKGIVLS